MKTGRGSFRQALPIEEAVLIAFELQNFHSLQAAERSLCNRRNRIATYDDENKLDELAEAMKGANEAKIAIESELKASFQNNQPTLLTLYNHNTYKSSVGELRLSVSTCELTKESLYEWFLDKGMQVEEFKPQEGSQTTKLDQITKLNSEQTDRIGKLEAELEEAQEIVKQWRPAFEYRTDRLNAIYDAIEKYWLDYEKGGNTPQSKDVQEFLCIELGLIGDKNRTAAELAAAICPKAIRDKNK